MANTELQLQPATDAGPHLRQKRGILAVARQLLRGLSAVFVCCMCTGICMLLLLSPISCGCQS